MSAKMSGAHPVAAGPQSRSVAHPCSERCPPSAWRRRAVPISTSTCHPTCGTKGICASEGSNAASFSTTEALPGGERVNGRLGTTGRTELNAGHQRKDSMTNIALEFISVFGLSPVALAHLAADLGYKHITAPLERFGDSVLGYPRFSLREDAALRRELIAV